MKVLLFVISILVYIIGFLVFSTAKSSMHEMVGLVILLNGTVFFATAFIIDAIDKLKPSTKRCTPSEEGERIKNRSEPVF